MIIFLFTGQCKYKLKVKANINRQYEYLNKRIAVFQKGF